MLELDLTMAMELASMDQQGILFVEIASQVHQPRESSLDQETSSTTIENNSVIGNGIGATDLRPVKLMPSRFVPAQATRPSTAISSLITSVPVSASTMEHQGSPSRKTPSTETEPFFHEMEPLHRTIGIDLLSATDNTNTGTGPFYYSQRFGR